MQSRIILYPELLKNWDTEKNGDKSPYDYSPTSRRMVHWICPKGHKFKCSIRSAVKQFSCTTCNSLAIKFPELSNQWHPSKNGELTPFDVSSKNDKFVWWLCSNGHEWEAQVKNRSNGNGCPCCAGQKASNTYNLALLNHDIASEWHPVKNDGKTPDQFTPGSSVRGWWKCSKNPKHEWCVRINARTSGNGCPYCSGQYADEENNFAILYPDIAAEWDYDKNDLETPDKFRPGSDFKAAWKCVAKGHEWKTTIDKRVRGNNCPTCSHKILHEDNCLATLYPEIAKQFHPEKNGEQTPKDFIAGTGEKVWWRCANGHEWYASISSRTYQGSGCPSCRPNVSRLELRVFAELSYYFSDAKLTEKIHGFEVDVFLPSLNLGIELDGYRWHKDKPEFDKNKIDQLRQKGLTLIRVREKPLPSISSHDVLFDKKETQFEVVRSLFKNLLTLDNFKGCEKSCIKEWLNNGNFINEAGYAKLLSTMALPKEGQSFAEKCPKLIDEWDFGKNRGLLPEHFYAMSDVKVHWKCVKKGHSWQTQIKTRAKGSECPYCCGRFACEDNCLATLHPDLAAQWDREKNGDLTPYDVTPGSGIKVCWRCKNNHSWPAAIYSRVKGNNCPMCSNKGHRKNYSKT